MLGPGTQSNSIPQTYVLLFLSLSFPDTTSTLSQGKLLTWFLCPGFQLPVVKSFLLFFVFSQLVDHSN